MPRNLTTTLTTMLTTRIRRQSHALVTVLAIALVVLIVTSGNSLSAQTSENVLPHLQFENSGIVTRDMDFRYFTQPDDYLENPDLWNIRFSTIYLYRVERWRKT